MSGREAAPLILASQSKARQEMLRRAGLSFTVAPAHIDEASLTEKLLRQGEGPEKIAAALAAEKAAAVAAQNPEALAIGVDQVLVCEGKILSKAKDKNEATERLEFLRGKTHSLISAVAVAQGKEILWEKSDSARLTMKNFGDEFLRHYAGRAGDALTRSVGAYELETLGPWLFSKVEGDFFTILGLPLLPLLHYLESQHGMKPGAPS